MWSYQGQPLGAQAVIGKAMTKGGVAPCQVIQYHRRPAACSTEDTGDRDCTLTVRSAWRQA